jgi:hypothetical protein
LKSIIDFLFVLNQRITTSSEWFLNVFVQPARKCKVRLRPKNSLLKRLNDFIFDILTIKKKFPRNNFRFTY